MKDFLKNGHFAVRTLEILCSQLFGFVQGQTAVQVEQPFENLYIAQANPSKGCLIIPLISRLFPIESAFDGQHLAHFLHFSQKS